MCKVIRSGETYSGRQGLDYGSGVSAESAGSRGLCMHRLTMPPGARAVAHLHADHESSIFIISGRGEFWWGERLEHHEVVEAGDFIPSRPGCRTCPRTSPMRRSRP